LAACLSALAIAAAVLVVAFIGRPLFGARVGLLAGLILAVAPFAVHYAQQLRAYGLLVLFVSLSSYFSVRGVEQPGWIPWSVYALTSSFLVNLHLFGALVIVAHATSLLFLDRANGPSRYLSVTAVVIGVLLLPLALLVAFAPGEPSWIHPPTLHSVAAVVSHVGGGAVLAVVLSVHCATAGWVAIRRWRRDRASLPTWRLAFAVLWLLVPFGAMLVFSLLIQPAFLDRYLIITLPLLRSSRRLESAKGVYEGGRFKKQQRGSSTRTRSTRTRSMHARCALCTAALLHRTHGCCADRQG
jgi:mannosyltransferase